MKVTFALTAQSLIRALRGRAHDLAEEADGRSRKPARPASRKAPRAMDRRRTKGRDRDDFAVR
jgi:hypothetical protein